MKFDIDTFFMLAEEFSAVNTTIPYSIKYKPDNVAVNEMRKAMIDDPEASRKTYAEAQDENGEAFAKPGYNAMVATNKNYNIETLEISFPRRMTYPAVYVVNKNQNKTTKMIYLDEIDILDKTIEYAKSLFGATGLEPKKSKKGIVTKTAVKVYLRVLARAMNKDGYACTADGILIHMVREMPAELTGRDMEEFENDEFGIEPPVHTPATKKKPGKRPVHTPATKKTATKKKPGVLQRLSPSSWSKSRKAHVAGPMEAALVGMPKSERKAAMLGRTLDTIVDVKNEMANMNQDGKDGDSEAIQAIAKIQQDQNERHGMNRVFLNRTLTLTQQTLHQIAALSDDEDVPEARGLGGEFAAAAAAAEDGDDGEGHYLDENYWKNLEEPAEDGAAEEEDDGSSEEDEQPADGGSGYFARLKSILTPGKSKNRAENVTFEEEAPETPQTPPKFTKANPRRSVRKSSKKA